VGNVRKFTNNIKGSRYNEDQDHVVWPVPMYIASMGTIKNFSKVRNRSSNGSTAKFAYVNLRTIFADGPKLFRREKHI
jgi:hypothetical protein